MSYEEVLNEPKKGLTFYVNMKHLDNLFNTVQLNYLIT